MAGFGRISTWQAGVWVAQLMSPGITGLWFGLASSDPFIGDPLAAELTGGTYARQEADFALTSATVMEQLSAVTFHGLAPGSVVAAVMLFDQPFGGNLISAYVLSSAVTLTSGGKYSFNAGDYVMGLDVATI